MIVIILVVQCIANPDVYLSQQLLKIALGKGFVGLTTVTRAVHVFEVAFVYFLANNLRAFAILSLHVS